MLRIDQLDTIIHIFQQVSNKELSVIEAANLLSISRPTFYKWYKRYQELGESALSPKKPEHLSGTRATQDEIELVLNNVRHNPNVSYEKLLLLIQEQKPGFSLGRHGLYNLLKQYNLSRAEDRHLYLQNNKISINSTEDVPVQIVDTVTLPAHPTFIPQVAPAPPPQSAFRLRLVFGFVFFAAITSFTLFSTLFISVLGYSSVLLSLQSLGIGFAFIALAFGGFFFLYSIKYYSAIAQVLLFSRKVSDQNINSNSNADIYLSGMCQNVSDVQLEKQPFVTVFLPIFNEKRVINRLLDAVTSFNYPNFEVIVCDDSTDETKEIVQEWRNHPRVKISHRETRLGYKGGALREAYKLRDPRMEFALVFDADFLPYPDTIEQFLKYFKKITGSLDQEVYSQSSVAAIQGYQWHVLNKSENWITQAVRSEYAGSYVIERSGAELYKGLKQIAGSVFFIRADISSHYEWGNSLTEDFELTLKLYQDGYKVVYTPYIQAPSECVSTLKRLVRQRMRWAEGHSFNIKKSFWAILFSSKMTVTEKIEYLYLAPYYLQSLFFLIGVSTWFISEAVLQVKLPFWTSVWGWSLVLTNMFALPLMNTVGLFLEEAEYKDYSGIPGFVLLSYLITPFQAYASVKGFLENTEGPWFRTPKTGKITDIFSRGKFFRFMLGIIPGHHTTGLNHSEVNADWGKRSFSNFSFCVTPQRMRYFAKAFTAVLLILSINISYLALGIQLSENPSVGKTLAFQGENNSSTDIVEKSQNSNAEATELTFIDPIHSPNKFFLSKDKLNEIGITDNLEEESLRYYSGKDESTYFLLTRSEKGIQKYAFDASTLYVVLSELEYEKENASFVKKLISRPIFQYQTKSGEWKDYIVSTPIGISITKEKDYALLTQNFDLFTSDAESELVNASVEFKLGMELSDDLLKANYISKFTFKMKDNPHKNRVVWDNQIIGNEKRSTDEKRASVYENLQTDQPAQYKFKDVTIDWTDFETNEKDRGRKNWKTEFSEDKESDSIIFYPEGINGAFEIDPTLSLSTASTYVQIDVANRYRARVYTNVNDNFVMLYDRAQNDSNPNNIINITQPYSTYEEGNYYNLSQDANRQTTIVESTATRVRIKIEGCLYNSTNGCLTDGTVRLKVSQTYTFQTEGIYIDDLVDFKNGLVLDSVDYNDYHYPFYIRFNMTDGAYSETVTYGSGVTEGTRGASDGDGLLRGGLDGYVVLSAADSYQSVIVGPQNLNGDHHLSNALLGYGSDYYNIDGVGESDLIAWYESRDQTIYGPGQATFFLLMLPQANLDTETERESYFNDLTNPDDLAYTTGFKWDDESTVFNDGYETNDFRSWNANVTDSGDLSIAAGAALSGTSYGLQAVVDDTVSIYTGKTGLNITSNRIRYRFYFDPNSMYSPAGTLVSLVAFYNAAGSGLGSVRYERTAGGSYYISASILADAGNNYGTDAIVFVDGPHYIEVEAWRASTSTSSDGGTNWWFDGQLQVGRTGVDNFDRWTTINAIYLGVGVYNAVPTDTSGTIYLDELVVNSDGSPIGPYNGYNEKEGAYTLDASGDQINVDIDGGSNVSSQLNGAVTAGATLITLDSSTGFINGEGVPTISYIQGDKFSYTDVNGNDLTGIPSTGELSLSNHADNSVVSSMTRHKPFYKIRNYRQNTGPPSVTLEGATLSSGTDYNTNLKPFSNSVLADNLLWSSSLDSASAIQTPDVGSGAYISSGPTYEVGKYGNGAVFTSVSTSISIPTASNFDINQGALEFWIKPTWNSASDGVQRNFPIIWTDSSNNVVFRKGTTDSLTFEYTTPTIYGSVVVSSANYSMVAGEWYHLKITWDKNASTGDSMRIFINGIEPTHSGPSATYDPTGMTIAADLTLGGNSTVYPGGTIDELKIYNSASSPVSVSKGGDTADTSEYLNDTDNDYSFDFIADDTYRRGDYLFLGSDSKFQGINVDLATSGVSGTASPGLLNVNHDRGNFNEYTATSIDGGDLSISGSAGLAGTSNGLSVLIDDATVIYGEKTIVTNTTGIVRWRFYFDPNTLAMADSDSFDTFFVYNSAGTVVATANIGYASGLGYSIRPGIKNDASVWTYGSGSYVTDAPHYVEMQLQRASSSVASDGLISWWVDGVAKTSVTGIDNYDMFNDFSKIRFGAPFGIDAGTSGTLYLDELKINDTGSEIGAWAAEAATFDWEYWNGNAWTPLQVPALADIIVDNGGSGTSSTGTWGESSSTSEYGGSCYYATPGGATDTYTFTPTIATAGNYRVYAWNSCNNTRVTVAPHVITYNGGSTTVNINQVQAESSCNGWTYLGTYNFAAGTSGNLTITDSGSSGGTSIGVDAAKFVYSNAVTDSTSGASKFTATGNFYFTAPTDWRPYSINGFTDQYYIRGHLDSGAYSTDPIENTMTTDVLLLHYLGDISASDQTIVAVPELIWPFMPIVLIGWWHKRRRSIIKPIKILN